MRSIETAVSDFVNEEPHRAVALETLRGPVINSSINGDCTFPSASLAKLPLAIALYEQAATNKLSLNERVSRQDLGRTAYPSILEVFSEQHEFLLSELCGLMLATSDNPVSQYLLDRVGIDAVNEQVHRVGAMNTHVAVGFSDHLLGDEGRRNITSANDALTILKTLAGNALYRPLIVALGNGLRNFRMPLRLPDELLIAHKTGSLKGVAVDAGIAYGRNVDLAIAFLTDHQLDTASTSIAIGNCMRSLWSVLGEELNGA